MPAVASPLPAQDFWHPPSLGMSMECSHQPLPVLWPHPHEGYTSMPSSGPMANPHIGAWDAPNVTQLFISRVCCSADPGPGCTFSQCPPCPTINPLGQHRQSGINCDSSSSS